MDYSQLKPSLDVIDDFEKRIVIFILLTRIFLNDNNVILIFSYNELIKTIEIFFFILNIKLILI